MIKFKININNINITNRIPIRNH